MALSIREIEVDWVHYKYTQSNIGDYWDQLEIGEAMKSIPFKDPKIPLFSVPFLDLAGPDILLMVLILCKNVETISLSCFANTAFKHYAVVLDPDYCYFPSLKNLRVSLIDTRRLGDSRRSAAARWLEDLQDVWILLSAPSLSTVSLVGLYQGYYEKDIHYNRHRRQEWLGATFERNRGNDNEKWHVLLGPTEDDEPRGLTSLCLSSCVLPETGIAFIGCYPNLQKLEYNISTWRGHDPSLEPLSHALRKVRVLETLILDIQVPHDPQFVKKRIDGRRKKLLGPLNMLRELKELTTAWYLMLGKGQSLANHLPAGLETLTLRHCDKEPAIVKNMLRGFMNNKRRKCKQVKKITLQAYESADDLASTYEDVCEEFSSKGLQLEIDDEFLSKTIFAIKIPGG